MNFKHVAFWGFLFISLSQFVYGQKRAVSITFDDLPGTHGNKDQLIYVNKKLLTTLKQEQIPTIGFVNESKLYCNEKPDEHLMSVLLNWLDADM